MSMLMLLMLILMLTHLNTGERREELVGIAFNRLMKMSLPGGDHLSTWRYNTVKVCHPSDHPPHLSLRNLSDIQCSQRDVKEKIAYMHMHRIFAYMNVLPAMVAFMFD